MLDLTDPCDDLKTPHRHDPHYCGGEEIHQRQFISEDELLPAFITSCPRLLSLQTTKPTVCERWK